MRALSAIHFQTDRRAYSRNGRIACAITIAAGSAAYIISIIHLSGVFK